MHQPHDMNRRILELEHCITANDKELQEIYAENNRLKDENARLREALTKTSKALNLMIRDVLAVYEDSINQAPS